MGQPSTATCMRSELTAPRSTAVRATVPARQLPHLQPRQARRRLSRLVPQGVRQRARRPLPAAGIADRYDWTRAAAVETATRVLPRLDLTDRKGQISRPHATSDRIGDAVTLRVAALIRSAGTMMARYNTPQPYQAPSGWSVSRRVPRRAPGRTWQYPRRSLALLRGVAGQFGEPGVDRRECR